MRLLNSFISSAVRGFNKKFPYFLCCASCGEIAEPNSSYFCSSVSPCFSVSAVVLVSSVSSLPTLLRQLAVHCPWLSNIVLVTGPSNSVDFAFIDESKISSMRVTLFSSEELNHESLQNFFCSSEDVSEHFLFLQSDCFLSYNLKILDFFTPNGIPLFKIKKRDLRELFPQNFTFYPSILALTKEIFLTLPRSFLELDTYSTMQFVTECAKYGYEEGKSLLIEDKKCFSPVTL